MSIPARRLDLVALDDYLAQDEAADERLEYAAGDVYALAGASRRHAVVTANLTARQRRVEAQSRDDASAPWKHAVAHGAGAVRLFALGGVDLPLDAVYARTDV